MSSRNDLYEDPEFRLEWDNNIPFHISQNVLHLRRYRGKSQQSVADAMGTSQAAIARIESGQENITLETLQRLINALEGRFSVSITPKEYAVQRGLPWWERRQPANTWDVIRVALLTTENTDRMLIGLERTNPSHTQTITPQRDEKTLLISGATS